MVDGCGIGIWTADPNWDFWDLKDGLYFAPGKIL
jgi:hypothetical protein